MIPLIESLVDNLGTFIFFSIGLIGILYLLSSRASPKMKAFGMVAITPGIIAFLSMVLSLSAFQDRFWYYAELTMAVPVGLALYTFVGDHKINVKSIASSCLVVGLVFFMIVCPSANMMNFSLSPNSGITIGNDPIGTVDVLLCDEQIPRKYSIR